MLYQAKIGPRFSCLILNNYRPPSAHAFLTGVGGGWTGGQTDRYVTN